MIRTAGFLAFVALLLTPPGLFAADPARKKHPHVLFLFTDDQRADTIAALGNPHIKTPNLDDLARRGFNFTNTYCMGSNVGAVCNPSRHMLLSGISYLRGPLRPSPDIPNFGSSFHKAGYFTHHHGKKGNSAQAYQALFEDNRYAPDGKERTSGEPGKIIADQTLELLSSRKDDRPFFMYLAFANPHDPRVAAKRYLDLYDLDSMPLPKNYLPVHPFNNGELKIRDEGLAPWPRTEPVIRKHLRDYYATITALDEQIGRIIQKLKDKGEYENTLIVFSSDHGLAIGSHGLMGKQSLYEHSMKAPLIFAGPGVPHGKSDAFAYLLDIYPTVCDLAGLPVPEKIDGVSLAPVIRGEKESVRDVIFTSYRNVQRAVRKGPWKLIRYPQINKTQLFNLADDPDEKKSLADDPASAARVKEMMALLKARQEHYGDKQELTSANPQPAAVDPSFFNKKATKPRKKKKS